MATFGTLMCGLALGASALLAQAPAPANTAGLMHLSLTALDTGGEPVTDLKADDFQITDQGKPQKIILFRREYEAAPAPGPNEYSNRTGGSAPHSTAILFDLLNTSQSDRLDMWHKLGRSLQEMESGDSLYLYLLTLEGIVTPIHAIGGKSGDDKTWTKDVEKTLDKAMKAASHARPSTMDDQEVVVKKTYVALETLANQLAPIAGHRDIIWITNAMPNVWNPKNPCNGDWVDCALYVAHLAVTINHDNVAVDPLSHTSDPSPDVARDLEQMAALTGGSTFADQDIRPVVAQISKDAAAGYSIYYDTPADNWDNKFHKIRVTTTRKGIKLRVKLRYYAYPDQRPETGRQQTALAAAFQSPIDDPSIGLHGSLEGAGAGKPGHLQLRVNPADVLLREEGGHFTGDLVLLTTDLGASGAIGQPALANFALSLTPEQKDAAMKEGIPIAQDHALNDSIKKVRVIVLDEGTLATGALTIPAGAGH